MCAILVSRHTVYSNYPFTHNNFEFCNVAILHVCVNLLRLRRQKVDSVAVEEGNCRIARAKDYNALEISKED